jgi:hypothetical protein
MCTVYMRGPLYAPTMNLPALSASETPAQRGCVFT